jgi:hypothetical protein
MAMRTNQIVAEIDRDSFAIRKNEMDAGQIVAQIDRDGFAMIRSVFNKDTAERARLDLDKWMDAPFGPENLGYPEQVLHLALPGKSKTLDAMIEHILTDPAMRTVLQRIGGANFKIRDINARRMTGLYNVGDLFNPPLEWHRDGPMEFGIGILLTDVDEGDAPTGFIKGSHKFAGDPRRDAILGMPFYTRIAKEGPWRVGLKWLTRCNPFSRRLWRKVLEKNVASASGQQGDIYIFINQAWHSRMENRNGKKSVVVLMGVWPSEAPFSVGTRKWPEETLAGLPPALAACLRADAPPNAPSDTLLARMVRERVSPHPFSLFWLAAMEKRGIGIIFEIVQVMSFKPMLRRFKAILRG